MRNNEFKCECCGGIFEKAWSDEECEDEWMKNFPAHHDKPRSLVCDDCYKILIAGNRN